MFRKLGRAHLPPLEIERFRANSSIVRSLNTREYVKSAAMNEPVGKNSVGCVVGAGTMGRGIAQVLAQSGVTVRLFDLNPEILQAAQRGIEENLAKAVSLGKLSEEARQQALARLSQHSTLLTAVQDSSIVIEAVPEKLDLKAALFSQITEVVAKDCLVASNTSSLSITKLAATCKHPERFLGMHFFNPVHLMKLVELVVHDGTSPAALAAASALCSQMNKTAIVVKDSPGFASSRLGIALGLEAMRMVEEGVASAADIDTAMKLGYGHPMGPLELTDLVGLDVRLAIAEYLFQNVSPSFAAPDILRDKVAQGQLGKKSGAGFFRWQDGKRI